MNQCPQLSHSACSSGDLMSVAIPNLGGVELNPVCSNDASARLSENGLGFEPELFRGAVDINALSRTWSRRGALAVVEDDPDDVVLLKKAFAKLEFDVSIRWLKSGREALEFFDSPNLIPPIGLLLDIDLTDMTGFELLDKLRSHRLMSSTRVVFLTGNRQPALAAKAKAYQADAYYIKPCGLVELVSITRQILSALTPAPA